MYALFGNLGFGDMMEAAGEMPEVVDFVISKPVTLPKFREALERVEA